MQCQILFSETNQKNVTNLSSAELVKRVLKVKISSLKVLKQFEPELIKMFGWGGVGEVGVRVMYLRNLFCLVVMLPDVSIDL